MGEPISLIPTPRGRHPYTMGYTHQNPSTHQVGYTLQGGARPPSTPPRKHLRPVPPTSPRTHGGQCLNPEKFVTFGDMRKH